MTRIWTIPFHDNHCQVKAAVTLFQTSMVIFILYLHFNRLHTMAKGLILT